MYFVPLFSNRYHRLMVEKYRSKRDKTAAAKGWAAREGQSVWETKRMMDIKLFLEGRRTAPTSWSCLQMFKHAANERWKEAQQIVCQGCQQGLPKLDPEADLSAVQLVGPKTTKEEITSLYLKVYKQQRLPGSPPGEPELIEEVVSSSEGCQGWKKERTPGTTARP